MSQEMRLAAPPSSGTHFSSSPLSVTVSTNLLCSFADNLSFHKSGDDFKPQEQRAKRFIHSTLYITTYPAQYLLAQPVYNVPPTIFIYVGTIEKHPDTLKRILYAKI